MCKHVAAVLYGVGARLDNKPELLFALRGVDHEELIAADAEKAVTAATSRGKSKRLAASELGEVFGIELTPEIATPAVGSAATNRISASPKKTRHSQKAGDTADNAGQTAKNPATVKAHQQDASNQADVHKDFPQELDLQEEDHLSCASYAESYLGAQAAFVPYFAVVVVESQGKDKDQTKFYHVYDLTHFATWADNVAQLKQPLTDPVSGQK